MGSAVGSASSARSGCVGRSGGFTGPSGDGRTERNFGAPASPRTGRVRVGPSAGRGGSITFRSRAGSLDVGVASAPRRRGDQSAGTLLPSMAFNETARVAGAMAPAEAAIGAAVVTAEKPVLGED